MPTANATFQKDPMNFMAANLVLPPMDSTEAKVRYVTLVKLNDCMCKTKQGTLWGKKLIDVYRLDFSTDESNSFPIYWLPYKNNAQFYMVLGDKADFLFTPLMDGCTFSHGGKDPKTPIVAHSNYQDKQGQIDQPKIDKEQGPLFSGLPSYTSLQKNGYTSSKHHMVGSGHVRSTTFGLLRKDVWYFYAQSWEDYHKAVKKKDALLNMDPSNKYFGSNAWDAELLTAGKSYELFGVFPI